MEVMVLATGKEIFRSTCGIFYLPTSIPEIAELHCPPPSYIEGSDDPYYPDAIEKYFARPRVYGEVHILRILPILPSLKEADHKQRGLP